MSDAPEVNDADDRRADAKAVRKAARGLAERAADIGPDGADKYAQAARDLAHTARLIDPDTR